MRVMIADQNRNVRSALRVLLEEKANMSVVAEVSEGQDFLPEAKRVKPDLVILDNGLFEGCLKEILAVLRRLSPNIPVIVLSGRPETERFVLKAGADYFINKAEPPERLLIALNNITDPGTTARGNDKKAF